MHEYIHDVAHTKDILWTTSESPFYSCHGSQKGLICFPPEIAIVMGYPHGSSHSMILMIALNEEDISFFIGERKHFIEETAIVPSKGRVTYLEASNQESSSKH